MFDGILVLLGHTIRHFGVELFCGITPLRARPTRETLRGIYIEGLANAAGHQDRHTPLENYCKGLLLPGERKSIEPMAGRLDPENTQAMRQSLHHLVAKAPWSDETLLDESAQPCVTGHAEARTRGGLDRGRHGVSKEG